jgi:spermidine synthase
MAIAALGASTAILQTLAVREGMAATAGDEAVLALLFGIWLVMTALGAAVGRKSAATTDRAIAAALAAHAALTPLTIGASRAASGWLQPGVAVPLSAVAVAACVLVGPTCGLAGWIYARLAAAPAGVTQGSRLTDGAQRSAQAYLLDTLGSGVAGLLLALFVLDRSLPFQTAGLGAAIGLLGAGLLGRGRWTPLGAIVALLAALTLWLLPLDRITYRWQAPGQQIVQARSSSRGALIVTRSQQQLQVLLERQPILTVPDTRDAQVLVHLSLALHPDPRDVLVIGAAPANSFALMRAHGVRSIDNVVGDPAIVSALDTWDPSARQPGVRLLADDERAWVRDPHGPYDVVIVHSGAPTSVSSARLFSVEFYRDLSRSLRPGGSVVVTMPPHASYANLQQQRMHSEVATTLRQVFSSLAILPASRSLYVAADGTLPEPSALLSTIESRLIERSVARESFDPALVGDWLSAQRLGDASRWASLPMPPSTDARPIVYRLALDASLSHFGEGGLNVLSVLAATIFLLALAWFNPRSRPVPFSVATTGFAGLALQLVLMLVYQTAVAALYRDVALVNAAFMGASCAGCWWAKRRAYREYSLLWIDLGQMALALAIAATGASVVGCGPIVARSCVLVFAASIGFASGGHIALASHAPRGFHSQVGGAVYAVDLIGSALAALITFTLVVPAVGIAGAALGVAMLKAVSCAGLLAAVRRASTIRTCIRVPGPAIALLVAVTLGVVDDTERTFFEWTVSRTYAFAVLAVLAAMLAVAFEPVWLHQATVALERRWASVRRAVGAAPTRWFDLIILLPLGALPLARCYFKIPYLFCHTCPRPCAFGLMRPYVVPAACAANLYDRRFCERICPVGLAQRSCALTRGGAAHEPGRVAFGVRLGVLVAVMVVYFLIRADRREGPQGAGLFTMLYVNRYGVSSAVLAVAGVLLLGAFLRARPFCDWLCPIGAVADLSMRIEKRWLGGRSMERSAQSDDSQPSDGPGL